ncbi:MAG TPA: LytTR family DNA-binding domain-containing protein [Solirubrobacteraceae bacterium]|nr:LytTR family DNA-binding domain-containing protein [Solirubrobacteraceae bacterium]
MDHVSAERLHILAVDDERSQLEDLARLLRTFPAVDTVECANGGRDALLMLSGEHGYDAVFLDVRMPDLDGVELGRVLRRFAIPPQLVFVSAYDSAAVEAFELHALDYLLKPVSRRRLSESLARVISALESVGQESPPPQPGVDPPPEAQPPGSTEMVAVANVRSGTTRLIPRSSILYAQSYGDFVRIVNAEGRYLLRATLSEVERRWAPFGFVRVHRQYLANLARAVELRPQLGGGAELVFGDDQAIPVARRHAAELSRRLRV